jgi:outer membrane protein
MRKLTFVLFFLLLSTVITFAQTQQGNFFLGGGFSGSLGNRKVETPGPGNTVIVSKSRSATLVFNPQLGFFVVNGFALGLDADIRNNSLRNRDNDIRTTASSFTLGPFARYYFPINVFLDGRVGLGSGKGAELAAYNESRIFSYSLGVGYAAFLNDHVALEPIIRYRGVNYTNKANDNLRTTNGNLEFAIGLQIYL